MEALTIERRNFLAAEHRSKGWPAIPDCPAHVAERIVEWRNANFSARRAVTPPAPKAVPVVTTEAKREQMRKRLTLVTSL
jgi:hypothetical protein